MRPFLLKTELQGSHSIDTSTSECWKTGEGLVDLEDTSLVHFDPLSEVSWQPMTLVVDSTLSSLPPVRPKTMNEGGVQLEKGQLGSPPISAISAPDYTITTPTTLEGPGTEHTTYRFLSPRSTAAADDWTAYNIAVYNGQRGAPPPTFLPSPGPMPEKTEITTPQDAVSNVIFCFPKF
jgi:hypothetical protein